MTKNPTGDRAGMLMVEFQGCPLYWFDNPGKYRFVRLGLAPLREIPDSIDYLGDGKTLVGVASDRGRLLLICHRHGDFEVEAYKAYPNDPTAKPIEGIAGSAFLDGRYPRRTL